MGDHGTMFKMVPETTYEFTNRVTCFKIDGADGAAVMAQPALPDPAQYKVGYTDSVCILRCLQDCLQCVSYLLD